jgi:hypothetical protein
LGFGGVNAFRMMNARLAVSASQLQQARLSSGARLPLGLSVAVAYARGTQQAWSVRGVGQAETDQTNTTWPDVTGRWTWTPRQKFLESILSNLSATAGLRVVSSEVLQPPLGVGVSGAEGPAGGVSTAQETRAYPMTLTVTWAHRINTSVSYSVTRSLADQAGSRVRNDRTESSARLNFSFRPPYELLPIKADIRTSLGYSASDLTGCITLAGGTDCIGILNSARQQYNFQMDTEMPPNVSAGLSIGYILTSDAVSNSRFAQFVLTVSVSVNFQAGQHR